MKSDSIKVRINRKLYQIERERAKLEALMQEWSELQAQYQQALLVENIVQKHIQKQEATVYDFSKWFAMRKI